eukprot:g2594.t1
MKTELGKRCDQKQKDFSEAYDIYNKHLENITKYAGKIVKEEETISKTSELLAKELGILGDQDSTDDERLRDAFYQVSGAINRVENERHRAIYDRLCVTVEKRIATVRKNVVQHVQDELKSMKKKVEAYNKADKEVNSSKTKSEDEMIRNKDNLQQAKHELRSCEESFDKMLPPNEALFVKGMKDSLNDFVRSQIHFHAMALQEYSKVLKYISDVDETLTEQEVRDDLKAYDDEQEDVVKKLD